MGWLSRVHQNKEVKEKAAADAASNVKVKDEPMDDSDDVKTTADASDSAAAGEVIDVSRDLFTVVVPSLHSGAIVFNQYCFA